jgi:hypothetical protein
VETPRLLKRVSILAVFFLFLTFAVALFGQIDMRSHGPICWFSAG